MMRDEQVRRYARHILLPDVGGLGQTALMVATARLAVDGEPSAAMIAAEYLAAGGIGTLVVGGATDEQRTRLAARGPDTRLIDPDAPASPRATDHLSERTLAVGSAGDVAIHAAPHWWPGAPGDATALAYWRGGVAAARWMAVVMNR